MGTNGLAFQADDRATPGRRRRRSTRAPEITGRGRITRAADTDYFAIPRPCAGTLTVSATPSPSGPNLDIGLKVFGP